MANRNISAGEEVSECYGQMYYTKNTDTRRQQLRDHYKFECQVRADGRYILVIHISNDTTVPGVS